MDHNTNKLGNTLRSDACCFFECRQWLHQSDGQKYNGVRNHNRVNITTDRIQNIELLDEPIAKCLYCIFFSTFPS